MVLDNSFRAFLSSLHVLYFSKASHKMRKHVMDPSKLLPKYSLIVIKVEQKDDKNLNIMSYYLRIPEFQALS
jgi:hypothetical protein